MSKVKKEALHSLIKRLNKGEKWKFAVYSNRFSGSDKNYILLFNELNKQSNYNEAALLKSARLRKTQLPNLKANLYKLVLNYLSQNTKRITGSATDQYINNAKFLYSKCLYSDCFTIVDKGKLEARNNYQLVLLLELLELEKMCILKTSDSQLTERIDKLILEAEQLSNQLNNINLLSNLSIKLNSLYQTIGFIRSKEDLLKVRNYYDRHLPKLNQRNLSESELVHLYLTITGFYLFIQDFTNAYKYSKRLLSVFESNEQLVAAKTEIYIKAINYVLVCQNKLYLYNDFRETQKMLVILKRNKKLICNENIALHLFKTIYIHQLNKHFMSGEFKQGAKMLAAIEKELHQFITILNKNTVLLFYYKIAALHIGSEQYKMALKWLHKIIHEKVGEVREDIQSFARILELICYYELNDIQMIDYKIRSTYRFLLKRKSFVKYQLHIMKFLRSINQTRTKKDLLAAFAVLKQNMLKLENSRFEKRAFIYFDIISWLESKIERRSVQEVVIAKAKLINDKQKIR